MDGDKPQAIRFLFVLKKETAIKLATSCARTEESSRRRCAVRRIDRTLLQYTPHDCPSLSWAAAQHCNLSGSDLLVKVIMPRGRTFLA